MNNERSKRDPAQKTPPESAPASTGVPSSVVVPERLASLLAETAELSERFQKAAKTLYLVGGSVRDAIAGAGSTVEADATSRGAAGEPVPGPGAKETDLDFTTNARPDDIEAIVSGWADSVWLQGKRFGTIGCERGGRRMEITTHRAETYDPDSRKPEVTFSNEVEADLSRRDFTVNAMALRLPDLELIDPFGGLDDLAAGRLRTPLEPEVSFGDDPLRMMRAARFIAGRNLQPDQGLIDAVGRMASRLAVCSPERIRDELDKLVTLPKPGPGLWFLVSVGLAAEFLPELPALALEQDPIHRHKDVLAHTIAVVEKATPDRWLRLAALFHDVGKPRTRAIGADGVSFHHHEVVGARMTSARMKALHYSNEDIEAVSRLVELHLRFHTYQMGWTDRAVRRYVRDADDLLDRLNELTRCDCTTRNAARAKALGRRMDELEARIAELRTREELDSLRPDLDGLEVMAILGLMPGPDVGRALSFLMELRLDEGPLGAEEARRRLLAWWVDAGAAVRATAGAESAERLEEA